MAHGTDQVSPGDTAPANPKQYREIELTAAIDIPAYAVGGMMIPEEIAKQGAGAVRAFVLANVDNWSNHVEMEPEYDLRDGLRIIEAVDSATDEQLFTDTAYPNGLPRHDMGTLALEVISQCEDEIIRSNLSRRTVNRLLAIIAKNK